jgi:DNA-binding PadR family transcriptional regulator
MQAIDQSPEAAYGNGIADQVSRMVRASVSDAQIYVALHRLEDRALIESWVDMTPGSSNRPRGRPRKYYRLTAVGRKILEQLTVPSAVPFTQSRERDADEGEKETGPTPTPVVA